MKTYSRNEVGGVYKAPVYDHSEYDTEFMANLCGGVLSMLGLFGLMFALVLFV